MAWGGGGWGGSDEDVGVVLHRCRQADSCSCLCMNARIVPIVR